jgi:hypothetical protein
MKRTNTNKKVAKLRKKVAAVKLVVAKAGRKESYGVNSDSSCTRTNDIVAD